MTIRKQTQFAVSSAAFSLLIGSATALLLISLPATAAFMQTWIGTLAILLLGCVIGSLTGVQLVVRFALRRQRRLNRRLVSDLADRKQVETELKLAKQQAEAASRSKSEFLANMSHEIRTPMTAIIGYADLLMESRKLPAEALRNLSIIRRNGEHLLEVLNDILDISKIEANRLNIETVAFSPCLVLYEIQSLMQARAAQHQLDFNIEFIGAMPETIQSDPLRFRQILINLVGNAIKFTESGAVRVVARLLQDAHAESKLQIDVIDTGIGIASSHIDVLFEPFTQADASTTRRFGGTGLGLSISRRLARKLGGDIEVFSELGRGSTFRFTVNTGPLEGINLLETTAELRTPFQPIQPLPHVDATLRGRILLAEDSKDNQRLIEFILSRWGLEVETVENGLQATDEALAAQSDGRPYDVILMDMQMPVQDGYDAVRSLRSRGYARPIIALTAHAMNSDRERCLRCGCDEFATKPINRTHLRNILERFIEAEPADSHLATVA